MEYQPKTGQRYHCKQEGEPMEDQLVAECEKLIFAVRQVVSRWENGDLASAIREAATCANEVEDFIVNNLDE